MHAAILLCCCIRYRGGAGSRFSAVFFLSFFFFLKISIPMANRAFFARLNKLGASPRRARRRAEGLLFERMKNTVESRSRLLQDTNTFARICWKARGRRKRRRKKEEKNWLERLCETGARNAPSHRVYRERSQ